MTEKQLRKAAYREARDAGLDTGTADAAAGAVLDRLAAAGRVYPRDGWERGIIDETIRDVIAAHAAP